MSLASRRSLVALVTTYGAYAGALMARGLELVGKLGLYMLGARVLGVHDSGYFFLCLTWVGLIATVARAGFEKAVIRHMAAELAVNRGREARRAFLHGTGLVTLGGSLATLGTVALAGPLAEYVFRDPMVAPALIISSLAILPQVLCTFMGHALVGFHRGAAGQLVQSGLWPMLMLAAVAVGVHSLEGVLYALAAANLAAAVLGVVLVVRERHRFHVTPPSGTVSEAMPALWRTAMPLGVVEMVQMFLASLPVLLLAAFGLPSAVGAFSVANRISMLIWVVSTSIGVVAAPSFAARHRQDDWDGLKALNRKVRLAVAVFGSPIVAAMIFFPTPILHLIGPGFEIAAPALMVMGVGQLINCLLSCQDIMLSMTGFGSVLRWLNTAQLVVCCTLCAALIPPFGMMGAAVATAVFAAQGAIGTTLAVRRYLPRAF
ncbi:oligosaccharide flippase family protein [Xanthobacter autotrophicus]|uniref:lipopolysaccharide biosynthesis protein n=1 Tax=Xanthobacter TaxID=279 RepID=UPI001E625EE7|nr:oligosaccharide flippase family protein [Xanthobacter autotrophicus]UDQ90868.1 oligosaccharide flippase family protein [Xanthobacter autotrophicus]